jgi:hypothetical protein
MKFIGYVRQVSDLAEGETAAPEADMGYEVRSIAGGNFEAGVVDYVIRRGDSIFARTTAGEEFAITGKNAHVLVPLGF